jgi:hypothetical protein
MSSALKTSLIFILMFVPLLTLTSTKAPPPPPTRICFAKNLVVNKVYESKVVFAAKVLNLTEKVVQRLKKEPRPLSSTTPTNYYHYSSFQAKRRRETVLVVHNVTMSMIFAKVKTVFKGDEEALEGKVVGVTVHEGGDGSKEARSLGKCVRKLRVGDTRVFFYKDDVDDGKSGVLDMRNQSCVPLPPTMAVLSSVRNAMRGKPL